MANVFFNIQLYITFIMSILIVHIGICSAINCFTCNSRNVSDVSCHDPFHPANSTYNVHCKTGKRNHVGLFPAKFCVKMKGRSVTTNEELVIRSCSLTNMDNQCGTFKFNDEVMKGCIVTCSTDGCNSAQSIRPADSSLKYPIFLVFPILLFIALQINK